MKLYELTGQYDQLLDFAATATDPEEIAALSDSLEGLEGELEQKVLGCARVIKELDASAVCITAEMDRLKARKQTLQNSIDRLKDYLLVHMQAADLKIAKDDLLTVSRRQNPPSVAVDAGVVEVPGFMRQKPAPPPEIDRKGICEALKAGTIVPGCHLERGESISIK